MQRLSKKIFWGIGLASVILIGALIVICQGAGLNVCYRRVMHRN